MAGARKRRQTHQNKTKARLIEELEALEQEVARQKRGAGGKGGGAANPLLESKEFFQTFFDHSPTALFVRDLKGRYLFVNRAYEEWYNVDRQDILGKTPTKVFNRKTTQRVAGFDREVLESGTRVEMETESILADGTTRNQRVIKFPLLGSERETIGVCGILTDLAGQKLAEKAILESEERFRALVECSPGAIIIRDLEGRNLIANKTFCDWHGIEREDILGKSAHDFLAKETADQIAVQERKVIETGTIVDEERRITYPTGVTREIFSQKFPILNPEGDCVAVGTVINDITDRKRAEEAIRESEQRLRGAIDSLQEGFALYDAEDRLAAFNEKYRRMRPQAQEIMERGGTFEDVTRANMKYEIIPEAIGREEAFIKERLKQHKNPKGPIIRRFSDGTWSRINEVKTPDGGTAITFIDLTELKQAEEALRESEQRFRDIAEVASDWIWEMGPDLRFTYFSERYAEVTGFPIEERIGTSRLDHSPENYTEEELEHWNAHIADLKARRPFKNFEYATTATPRGLRYVRVSGRPVFGKDGEFLGYRGTGTDITERKLADEALRQSQARLANILDNSPAPIYFKDTEGRFLVANRQYQKIYKVDFEDIRGKTSKEIFGDETGGKFLDHDRAVLESRKMIEREENFLGKTYLTLKFPIIDPSGELLGLGGIETDVSEIKKVEKELHAAKERAEFANRAKTEFLANMSHELRTPLNSILGFSEVLMIETFGPLGSDKYKEYAADIHSSGTHLLDLISEVLDLSKLETGQLKLIESDIDVTETVTACVRMVEGRSDEERASISTRFENGLPMLRADERRFKQILLNLIGNAVKFTPPEGSVKVSTRVSERGKFTIEVADNG
ncbi:MAG: PAS domain-containing protein, partial [Proteobacteria bacterium]|nr:PAS domain-containing protein [Pseudomonadota bacterium]